MSKHMFFELNLISSLILVIFAFILFLILFSHLFWPLIVIPNPIEHLNAKIGALADILQKKDTWVVQSLNPSQKDILQQTMIRKALNIFKLIDETSKPKSYEGR